MTIKYLKKAIKTPSTDDHKTREAVQYIAKTLKKELYFQMERYNEPLKKSKLLTK